MPRKSSSHDTGSALAKAVAVLDVLMLAERSLSLGEISQRTDLPRQTIHRIVRQLEEQALLRRDPGGDGYGVGPRMLQLSLHALAASARTAPMRTVLQALVAELGETCNLGVLARDEVVYIERVECDWSLRVQYGVGSRVPLYATAIGKLLMAHLPARERRRLLRVLPLMRLTERTLTDPERLEAEFAAIRRQGYAANDQEAVQGLIGLAVPVRDARGKVVAGLSMHAPDARMPMSLAITRVGVLQNAARQLEELIREDQEFAREPLPAVPAAALG